MKETCQCWDLLMPQPDTTKAACSMTMTATCVVNSTLIFYESDEVSNCFLSCPLECNSVGFGVQMSRGDFPSPNYAEIMLKYAALHPNSIRNFTSYDQIKSSSLAINIYFDDIGFTQVCNVFLRFQLIGSIIVLF